MLCGLQQLSPVKGNTVKPYHTAAQALASPSQRPHQAPPAAAGPGAANAHAGPVEEGQHLPLSSETRGPEEGVTGAGPGAACQLPSGLLGSQHGPASGPGLLRPAAPPTEPLPEDRPRPPLPVPAHPCRARSPGGRRQPRSPGTTPEAPAPPP